MKFQCARIGEDLFEVIIDHFFTFIIEYTGTFPRSTDGCVGSIDACFDVSDEEANDLMHALCNAPDGERRNPPLRYEPRPRGRS